MRPKWVTGMTFRIGTQVLTDASDALLGEILRHQIESAVQALDTTIERDDLEVVDGLVMVNLIVETHTWGPEEEQ